MNNFLITIVLLCFQLAVFAQKTDTKTLNTAIKTLQKELKIIQKSKGKTSLECAQKLIELGTVYYKKNSEKPAMTQLNQAEIILQEKTNNIPDTCKDKKAFKQAINNGIVAIDFIKWHFYIQKKDYENAEKLLKEKKWFALSINTKNFNKIIELLEVLANDSSSESDVFLKYWEDIYWSVTNLADIENMWQFLLKKRAKESGANSNPHLSALFGMSHFYKRYYEIDKYTELRNRVELHWDYAYEGSGGKSESLKDTTISAQQPPRFPGCESKKEESEKKECANQNLAKFIGNRIVYPTLAREHVVEGKVLVKFIVTKYGTLIDPIIVEGIGSGCDEEVLRIVGLMNELPSRWTPGKHEGKIARIKFKIPVRFKLT